MSAEPDFLSVGDVTQIHDEQIAAYGGGAGVRDQALLESAVAMPQASFGEAYLHELLAHMAAAYAFHIAQNQPFLDGNKRTGLVAAHVFPDLNGVTVLDPQEGLYDAMVAIAERRMDKDGLASFCGCLVFRVKATDVTGKQTPCGSLECSGGHCTRPGRLE